MTTMLVTGATGRQGGAVAAAALAARIEVRALVRDPTTGASRALADAGAELAVGDLDQPSTLRDACAGADAVFSVQQHPMSRSGYGLRRTAGSAGGTPPADIEFVQAQALITASRAAGVRHVIQSTAAAVAATDGSGSSPLAAKYRTEQFLAQARPPAWTVLRPGFFMENLPSYLGAGERLVTGLLPTTELGLIAVDDIGAAAVAAVQAPDEFHGRRISLVGEVLTLADISETLAEAWGRPIEVSPLTRAEAAALGLAADIFDVHRRIAEAPPPGNPADMRAYGLPVTTLAEWAVRAR